MTEKTLQELSAQAKVHFEAREFQQAANCLVEARSRFPQEVGAELSQHGDGSIVVSRVDAKGSEVREPV